MTEWHAFEDSEKESLARTQKAPNNKFETLFRKETVYRTLFWPSLIVWAANGADRTCFSIAIDRDFGKNAPFLLLRVQTYLLKSSGCVSNFDSDAGEAVQVSWGSSSLSRVAHAHSDWILSSIVQIYNEQYCWALIINWTRFPIAMATHGRRNWGNRVLDPVFSHWMRTWKPVSLHSHSSVLTRANPDPWTQYRQGHWFPALSKAILYHLVPLIQNRIWNKRSTVE